MAEHLASLRLKLHERKCRVFPASCGTEFLGYRVFADHRWLRASSLKLLRRKMRTLQERYAAGEMSLDRVGASVRSWIAHASHADTWSLREDVLRRHALAGGQAEHQSRALRGGNWNNNENNCRVSNRNNNSPTNWNNNNGFRCASTPACRSLAE